MKCSVGATGVASTKSDWRGEKRGGEENMLHFFQTAVVIERVGMVLDKLPDPLPLRHSKQ